MEVQSKHSGCARPTLTLLHKVFKLCFPSTYKPMMGCVHRQVWRRVPLSTWMGHNRMLFECEVNLGNLAAVVITVTAQQEGWGFKSPRGQLGPFLCGVCLFSLGLWVSSHSEIATLNWPQCECEWLFTVTWQPVQGASKISSPPKKLHQGESGRRWMGIIPSSWVHTRVLRYLLQRICSLSRFELC